MQPVRLFKASPFFIPLVALAAVVAVGGGCRKAHKTRKKPVKKALAHVSDADIAKYKPNEAGAIMVVMYHRIRATEPPRDLNRPPAQFRQDLETLYKEGYYPVNAFDIVSNHMEVPIGKTPIALTFDDSLPTQFRIITGKDGQAHIDPDCAVGIMESFSKQHPDWPLKATFFVLPREGKNGFPFGQMESVDQKFSYLNEKGYEIANHTSTHPKMLHMPAAKIKWELATALRDIKKIDPSAGMNVMALPYGSIPKAKDGQAALLQGEDGGTTYHNKAVFLAADRPILSPVTRNDKKLSGGQFAPYNIERLERVVPDSRNPKEVGTFEYWLSYFQQNPSARYISDGNDKVCTVPAYAQSWLDMAKVKSSGQRLQVYGGAATATKVTAGKPGAPSGAGAPATPATGGGLSVE